MIFLLRPQVAAPRLAAWIVCILAVNSLAGCGGGSTSSSSPDPNPTPSLASSSVSSAITAGGGAFTLTVTGSNFVSSSVVQWNGTARPTTFVSSSSLQAAISAADISKGGTASITIATPAPGGGTSNAITVAIDNPAPVLAALNPNPALAGTGAFTLMVTGSNFVSTSVVQWNATPRATTFVSSTSLQAAITAADVSSTGSALISVVNPAPAGGTSNALTLPIVNPVPIVTSLNPGSVIVGSAAFPLTVNGSDFVPSSIVQWNGTPRATTFVSSTSLQAAITAADIAATGIESIAVITPTPGGGTSAAVDFMVDNPLPVVTSLNPGALLAGSPAFTLTLNGSGFVSASVVQWNGSPRPTTFVSSTQLRADIPALDVAASGTANVTVFSPTPGGGTSTVVPFLISAVAIRSVSTVATPNYMAWDAPRNTLYVSVASTDPSIPNTIVAVNPLTGTAGNPIAAGNNPDRLSISSDDAYLWVGLDGDFKVQRFNLPALTKDISFLPPKDPFGSPQQAVDIQADPFSAHTVALSLGNFGYSPTGYGGVYIYDDATPRPTSASGHSGAETIDQIHWGANGSTLYGTAYVVTPAGVSTFTVNSSGVSLASFNGDIGPFHPAIYDRSNGHLYDSFTNAFDPATGSLLGGFRFNSNISSSRLCTPDSSTNRYICVEWSEDPALYELSIFDLNSYALLDRYYLNSNNGGTGPTVSVISGQPAQLLRWGNSGLALATVTAPYLGNSGLFLLDGPAVNPGAAPDVSSGTVTSTTYPSLMSLAPSHANVGSGEIAVTLAGTNFTPDTTVCYVCFVGSNQFFSTTFVNPQKLTFTIPASALTASGEITVGVYDSASGLQATNTLSFSVDPAPPAGVATQITPLDLAGLSMAYDANSALLYVGTADYETQYPNSVVAINPVTAAIATIQAVGANPDLLSVGAGGQYLYLGFGSATEETQVQLPSLNNPVTWVLRDPVDSKAYWAGNLVAAPQNPHTTALNLFNLEETPSDDGGIVIYDDAVLRPDYVVDRSAIPSGGLASLAWSSTDQLLTGDAYGTPLSTLQVTPSGVSYLATGTDILNSTTAAIHSDFGTGLIYSDSGKVADPATRAVIGDFHASGLVAPDSALNLVFILGQTAAQTNTTNFTIQSFNQKTYAPVSSITIENVLGTPTQLVSCGQSALAILTSNYGAQGSQGRLYLIQDVKFVHIQSVAISATARAESAKSAEAAERVTLTWRPITAADNVKRLHSQVSIEHK